MSDEERAHYRQASGKQNSDNQRGASNWNNGAGQSVKYSSQGVSLSQIEVEEREREEEKIFMKRSIEDLVFFSLENDGELF